MVFGPLVDGDYMVSGYRLRIARSSGELAYSRFNDRGEVFASARLSESLNLSFIPVEPAGGPGLGLIECIYLKLSEPIVIDSNGRLDVKITAPVDYGVVAHSKGGSYSLVDSFPESSIPYKLALYGPPTQGVICRFHKADPGKPQGPGLASLNVRVVNETEGVARVNTIIIPLGGVKVFYKPGTWVAVMSNASMVLESSNVASIHFDPEPVSADFDESPDIVKGDTHPMEYVVRGKGEFKMIWGY